MNSKVYAFFDKSFFQGLVLLVVGLSIGVPFGLWTNALIQSTSQGEARRALVEGFVQLLDRNRVQLKRIRDSPSLAQLELDIELTYYESTAAYKYQILDVTTCRAIDEVYGQLRIYQRKVQTRNQFILSHPDAFVIKNGKAMPRSDDVKTDILAYAYGYTEGSMAGHHDVILKRIEETRNLLEQFSGLK